MTSVLKRTKLPVERLEEAARSATHIALQFRAPIKFREQVTLGTRWENDSVVFELYVAKERPQDAIVLTETRVNVYDGRVESVHVFDEALAAQAPQS